MKKHIVQQGKAQCRREFTIDGEIDKFSDERLSELADKLDVDWVIDPAVACTIESVQIREIDPSLEIDCAEFECLADFPVQQVTIDGKAVEDFSTKVVPGSVEIILTDPPYSDETSRHNDEE